MKTPGARDAEPPFIDGDAKRVLVMIRAARITATIVGLAIYGDSAAPAQVAPHQSVLLSWMTPEGSGCPDAAYVLAEVHRFVGEGAARHRAPISATATIRAVESGGFQLILKTGDGESSGERTFRDESCRALADAAVVILAWMVAPEAVALASESKPTSADLPSLPRVVPSKPAPPSSVRRSGPMPHLGLGVASDAGTLPAPALGGEVRLGISFQRLRLEARASYWPSRRKRLPALPSGEVPGATFTLGQVGLQACLETLPEAARSRLRLALCLGPELDVLNGAGSGVTAPSNASKTWVSFSSGVEVSAAMTTRLHLFLSVAGVIPTAREHFALRGVGEIYRPSPVAGRGTLGVALDL
jgi:hypothetical protein